MRVSRPLILVLVVLAISVLSSRLITFVTSRPSQPAATPANQAKYQALNQAKFQSLLDQGRKSLNDQRYDEALAHFDEAQRSSDQLTDAQYASLQESRKQIAEIYVASGRNTEAEGAYTSMIQSSLQEGWSLYKDKRFADALSKFLDAEELSQKLTTTRLSSLNDARSGLVSCLRELHRYPEAEQATLRMIDDLRASSEEYDLAFAQRYIDLAMTRALSGDWNSYEAALVQALESCDRSIQHFSQFGEDPQNNLGSAASLKGYVLYYLAIAYEHNGKVDLALSTVDDLYKFSTEFRGPAGEHEWYSLKDTTKLGLEMSTTAKRQDLIGLWRQRQQSLSPGTQSAGSAVGSRSR